MYIATYFYLYRPLTSTWHSYGSCWTDNGFIDFLSTQNVMNEIQETGCSPRLVKKMASVWMIRLMLVKLRRLTLCSSVPVGALPVSTSSFVNMDMSTGAEPILGIFFGVTVVTLELTRFVPFFSGFGNSSLKVSIHARNSAPWVAFVCQTFCTLSGTWMPAASPSTWDTGTVDCCRCQVPLQKQTSQTCHP